MKIEHEKVVSVVPYPTIGDALIAGLAHHLLDGISNRIRNSLGLNRETPEERELSEILRERLFGHGTYERTLALASIDKEMGVHEFYQKLSECDCYPASLSEAMSYLPNLAKDGVEVDFVLHLGVCIWDKNFMEKKLLTRKNGDAELVPFYHATKLKPHYTIVVVKEEKKLQKK